MKRYIYICSPYRGANKEERRANERAAIRYCRAVRDEYPNDTVIPIAPHLYYPRFLDEDDPAQRALGLECALENLRSMLRHHRPGVELALYVFGGRVSEGMAGEIAMAEKIGIKIRYLPADYGQGKKRAKAKLDDPRFDAFWEAYPRKVDKEDARKAWAGLAPDGAAFERIMAGLESWKKAGSWNRDGNAYIPHPATWLNKRRWESEPDLPEPARKDSKFSYFMNYKQRRYSDDDLKALGLPMPGEED